MFDIGARSEPRWLPAAPKGLLVAALAGLAGAGVVGCSPPETGCTVTCTADGICYDQQGNLVDANCQPVSEPGGGQGSKSDTCECVDGVCLDADGNRVHDDCPDTQPTPEVSCRCEGEPDDADADCIPDDVEEAGATDPNAWDSDGDGIGDGCEDRNRNGQLDQGEYDPTSTDSDGDGIADNLEDKNGNGLYDPSPTNAETRGQFVDADDDGQPDPSDTDEDGIPDGEEDRNGNGQLDSWEDTNGDGCFDAEDTPGETDPTRGDSDADGIPDAVEDANDNGVCDPGETCAFVADTDCDGLADGREDKNHNGALNTGETDPLNPDSDGDGIPDGVEDADGDGRWDANTETNPLLYDSDGDSIPDGVEDANQNGQVDAFDDANDNGCWDEGEAPGESDPTNADSDGDGLSDSVEDRNRDGVCEASLQPDPVNPDQQRWTTLETCAWLVDTDCDGLGDGQEDANRDGQRGIGELDPRDPDTDRDGLVDGCPPFVDIATGDTSICEDTNRNGEVNTGETNPRVPDTDGDRLLDGCEVFFADCSGAGCGLDPLSPDTDNDGIDDGEEDANQNCQVDGEETDPRSPQDIPGDDTKEGARLNVCANSNLKRLTFAASDAPEHDYRLAFEVETGPNGEDAEYLTTPFDVLNPYNAASDALAAAYNGGHVFQSPTGVVVDEQVDAPINRDIYGAVVAGEQAQALDDYLDGLAERMDGFYETKAENAADVTPAEREAAGVEVVSATTERPAHDDNAVEVDDNPLYPISRARRALRVTVAKRTTALALRNEILQRLLVRTDEDAEIEPASAIPQVDPVYGPLNCPFDPQCQNRFNVYIGTVKRALQTGPNAGEPVIVTVLALTPDLSESSNSTLRRWHADRLTRLEDLTGGSALARYEATTSKDCLELPYEQATADMLFVVDDSASMQQIIERLEQAARDARAVLTANANNVDFRVGLTTTNPASVGPPLCDASAPALEQLIQQPGSGDGCTTNPAGELPAAFPASYPTSPPDPNASTGQLPLPGGGGTFYFEDATYLDCDGTQSGIQDCGASAFAGRFGQNAGLLGADLTADCASALMNIAQNPVDAGCGADPSLCCERVTEACSDGPTVLASQMCNLIREMGGRASATGAATSSSARLHSAPEYGTRSARRLLERMLPALPRDFSATGAGGGGACTTAADCNMAAGQRCINGACAPADPKLQLRLACKASTEGCEPCDPRDPQTDPNSCPVVPLLTIFLSDEEAAWLKDECAVSAKPIGTSQDITQQDVQPSVSLADRRPLPSGCWPQSDADCAPKAEGACTNTYGCEWNPQDEACQATSVPCTVDYCTSQGFELGVPDGYNPVPQGDSPDLAPARASRNYSIQWRTDHDCDSYGETDCPAPGCYWDSTLQECVESGPCSAGIQDLETTCLAEPCHAMGDETSCNNYTEAGCHWGDRSCHQPCEQHTNCFYHLNRDGCEATPGCEWDADASFCDFSDRFTDTNAADQRTNCEADPQCRWDQARVRDPQLGRPQQFACVRARPINDCRACKRYLRTLAAVQGGSPYSDAAANPYGVEPPGGEALIGFMDVGPVYSIVRNKGAPGRGNALGETIDECAGGPVTWGRGDGQAYRDLAISTLGRTQNVCVAPAPEEPCATKQTPSACSAVNGCRWVRNSCAPIGRGYQDFMQLVVNDIVSLSAPYPLAGAPIASTIKVGIARPQQEDDDFEYIPVPRSRSRGFVYNPTTNSIAFKSDPVDGDCDADTCPEPDGIIDDSEIRAAQKYARVPRQGDTVFVSYRLWRPVPCNDKCGDNETCALVPCSTAESDPPPCEDDGNGNGTCVKYANRICNTVNQCVLDCSAGESVYTCVPSRDCGECEEFNVETGECEPVDQLPNGCDCEVDPSQLCNPDDPASCEPGFECTEGCSCQRIQTCQAGFLQDGGVKDCDAAVTCCEQWQQQQDACLQIENESDCGNDPNCQWNNAIGQCESIEPPCCEPGEAPECFEDPETGAEFINCSSACNCRGAPCTTNADCEGTGFPACVELDGGEKVCSCDPVNQICGESCTCEFNPQ